MRLKNGKSFNYKYVFIAILSSLLYGGAGLLRKIVTLKGLVYSQQIYSALGIVVAGFLYLIFTSKKVNIKKENTKQYSLAFLSGFFYYFASFFMLLSYKYIEGSITFSIIQLNAIWAGLIGIFIFKEIDYKKHYKKIIFSLIFAMIGIGLLVVC